MRGCLTLVLGFVLGAGLMLYLWPHPPTGTSVPQPADLRVLISDDYLSRKAAQKAASLSIVQVQNVRITSAPPSLIARADIGAAGLLAPATIELHPQASNGTLDVQIVSVDFAGLSLPGALTSLFQDTINSTVQQHLGTAARITSVQVTPGGLEIFANYG